MNMLMHSFLTDSACIDNSLRARYQSFAIAPQRLCIVNEADLLAAQRRIAYNI